MRPHAGIVPRDKASGIKRPALSTILYRAGTGTFESEFNISPRVSTDTLPRVLRAYCIERRQTELLRYHTAQRTSSRDSENGKLGYPITATNSEEIKPTRPR